MWDKILATVAPYVSKLPDKTQFAWSSVGYMDWKTDINKKIESAQKAGDLELVDNLRSQLKEIPDAETFHRIINEKTENYKAMNVRGRSVFDWIILLLKGEITLEDLKIQFKEYLKSVLGPNLYPAVDSYVLKGFLSCLAVGIIVAVLCWKLKRKTFWKSIGYGTIAFLTSTTAWLWLNRGKATGDYKYESAKDDYFMPLLGLGMEAFGAFSKRRKEKKMRKKMKRQRQQEEREREESSNEGNSQSQHRLTKEEYIAKLERKLSRLRAQEEQEERQDGETQSQ